MDEPYVIWPCDCQTAMRYMDSDSIDSVVCDPPYGLSKEPDVAEVMRHWLAGDDYVHTGAGFMGKSWDSFVPGPAVWREAYRVLKPGGHLIAFFGTRTYDLGVMALRLAGFEIRDQLAWVFGSGFPKSHDVSKGIGKMLGAEREIVARGASGSTSLMGGLSGSVGTSGHDITKPATPEAEQWEGWGTALKPAYEPIVLARKPLSERTVAANVLRWGTGALNIDGCRIEAGDGYLTNTVTQGGDHFSIDSQSKTRGTTFQPNESGRWPANLTHDGHAGLGEQGRYFKTAVFGDDEWLGQNLPSANASIAAGHMSLRSLLDAFAVDHVANSALLEETQLSECPELSIPVTLSESKSVCEMLMQAMQILESALSQEPQPTKLSLSLDLAQFAALLTPTAITLTMTGLQISYGCVEPITFNITRKNLAHGARDSEPSTARFKYCPKASKADRNRGLEQHDPQPTAASQFRPNHAEKAADGQDGNPYGRWKPERNFHSTVKPSALMQWLCRMVTPPGGTVLDPFTGSGTTGVACAREGFTFVGCEMTEEYLPLLHARISYEYGLTVRG